jgi:hypothetical protein
MGFVFKSGRNLVGFEITLYNVPGSLSTATGVFKQYNVNIVFIEMFSVAKEEGILFVVGDFTDVEVDPDMVYKDLKDLRDYIKDVNIAPTIGDIVYSSNIVVKDLGGVRAIIWSHANMSGFIEGVREKLGVEMGVNLLFHIGRDVGEKVYDYYIKKAGVSAVEDVVSGLNAVISGHKWGKIIDSMVDDKRVILRFSNLWECEVLHNKVSEPASNFFRGVLCGLFSRFYGREVVVREVKCVAVGDNYCEYVIEVV